MAQAQISCLTAPSQGKHTHTLVMLHGRGSRVNHFATDTETPGKPGLLHLRTSENLTLQERFPGLKIVCPEAPLRRCTARSRMRMHVWFDTADFEDPSHRQELQIDGLQTNARNISEIVQAEAKVVGGFDKVFLGGLSQGCAMALYVLFWLELARKRPAGFIGFSGWLPSQNDIEIAMTSDAYSEDDIFESDDHERVPTESCNENNRSQRAFEFVRAEIFSEEPRTFQLPSVIETPTFLGHGDQDEVVPLQLGKDMTTTLTRMGFQSSLKVYAGLGHWFPSKIDDLVEFIDANM